MKDLEAGNLEAYLKSEPIPTDNSGPVTVAVAKNFEDTITNNGKDTLIEFYAPWYVINIVKHCVIEKTIYLMCDLILLGADIAKNWHQFSMSLAKN